MESIYLLVPLALIFTALAIKIFFWAIDSKQFDDLDSAGKSILFDDEPSRKTPETDKADNTSSDNHDSRDSHNR
jgi:cbb3-type cytochrome oxidase maturation protein